MIIDKEQRRSQQVSDQVQLLDEASEELSTYRDKICKDYNIAWLPFHPIDIIKMVRARVQGHPEEFERTLAQEVQDRKIDTDKDLERIINNRNSFRELTLDFLFPDKERLFLKSEHEFKKTVQERIQTVTPLTCTWGTITPSNRMPKEVYIPRPGPVNSRPFIPEYEDNIFKGNAERLERTAVDASAKEKKL